MTKTRMTKTRTTKTRTPVSPDHDSIALRAYFMWEAEGRPEGRHDDHWLAAEAAEKRSLAARRAAATRRAKQAAAPVAAPIATQAAVVAAVAVSKSRAAATRTGLGVH